MIHQFTTANGLKVIGIESHKSPVVSVQIWTRNGSADERAGDEGLSHFIEHLVFKGTRSYVAGEIAARVEACGGEINAYTSFDQTVYYITISKEFYTEALKIIAEMISSPRFDQLEVDREREVVIEEIKRSHDSLGRRASRLLFSNYFTGHPYAVPVIGYEKNILEVSVDRLKKFFADRYVVDNMFLVVTGNFETDALKNNVETYFSDVSRSPLKKPKREEPAPLVGQKVFVEEAPFEEAVFYLTWPGVKVDHKDLAALECLLLIFGQGASSRLYRTLRLKKDLVNSIGAGLWAPSQAAGFLSVSGSLNLDKMEAALEEVRLQIEILLRDGVSEQELQKAKTNFLAEEAYILETVGGLARKFGGNYEATEDLYFHEKFHQQLEGVTTDTVLQVARKYLRSDNQLAAAIVPRDKEKTEALLQKIKWTTPAFKMSESTQPTTAAKKTNPTKATQSGASQVESKILSNKLKTFYSINQEAPIYNLRLALLGGSRVVSAEKAGLAELAGRVWSSKTQSRSEDQIREKCDSLASSLYSFSGRNTIGLVVDGLTEHEEEMAELLSETIEHFAIDESILAREKNSIFEALRSRKDSPSTITSLWFQKMLFQNHPYSLDPMGTVETVGSLTAKDVERYLQSFLASETGVAAISGDFKFDLWQKALSKVPSQKAPALTAIGAAPQKLTEDLYHYEKLEKEQTHIIYGVHGLSLDDPERYTLQVLEAVLSGQGGRLFIELRDKASLAYSVSPLRMEGLGTGYFATYIGCSPEKADTAIQMMKEEWQKMAEFKISNEELLRAQNYLVGGHDIGLQKNSAISSSIAFNEVYGNSYKEMTDFAHSVRAVDADKVQKLAQRLFSQKAALSVVGPQEPKHRPKKSFS